MTPRNPYGRICAIEGAAITGPAMIEAYGPAAADVAMATAITLALKAGRSSEQLIADFGRVAAQVAAAVRVAG